jgi:hypothetical protein
MFLQFDEVNITCCCIEMLSPPKRLSNNTAVQLNGYLVTCSLNSKSDYNETSTKHKDNTKTVQIHKGKTLNKQIGNYNAGEHNLKKY